MNRILPPCYRYILYTIDYRVDNERYIFVKNFMTNLKSHGYDDDAMLGYLMQLPTCAFITDPGFDLTVYKEQYLWGDTAAILNDPELPECPSCQEYYAQQYKRTVLCSLCPYSSSYSRTNADIEYAIAGYMIDDVEKRKEILAKISDLPAATQIFVSSEDVFQNLPGQSRPAVARSCLDIWTYVSEGCLEQYSADCRFIDYFAKSFKPYLLTDVPHLKYGNSTFTDEIAFRYISELYEVCSASAAKVSYSDALAYIERTLHQTEEVSDIISPAVMQDANSSPEQPLQSDESAAESTSATTESMGSVEGLCDDVNEHEQPAPDASSQPSKADNSQPPKLVREHPDSVVTFPLCESDDDIYHIILTAEELGSIADELIGPEIFFRFENALKKEEALFLEVGCDPDGHTFLLIYLSDCDRAYYTFFDHERAYMYLKEYLSQKSIPLVTFLPFHLYSICRSKRLRVESVLSIHTFVTTIFPRLSSWNYVSVMDYVADTSAMADDASFAEKVLAYLKLYPAIYRHMRARLGNDVVLSQTMKETALLFEALGSNYLLSAFCSTPTRNLFTYFKGDFNFNSELFTPRAGGYILSLDFKDYPDIAQDFMEHLLSSMSSLGWWRTNMAFILMAVKESQYLFWISDDKDFANAIMSYCLDVFILYQRSLRHTHDESEHLIVPVCVSLKQCSAYHFM